jgi:hypothetical protein
MHSEENVAERFSLAGSQEIVLKGVVCACTLTPGNLGTDGPGLTLRTSDWFGTVGGALLFIKAVRNTRSLATGM